MRIIIFKFCLLFFWYKIYFLAQKTDQVKNLSNTLNVSLLIELN